MKAFCLIEYLLNGVDCLARAVMDADETYSFCVHLDAALSVLDDMDRETNCEPGVPGEF